MQFASYCVAYFSSLISDVPSPAHQSSEKEKVCCQQIFSAVANMDNTALLIWVNSLNCLFTPPEAIHSNQFEARAVSLTSFTVGADHQETGEAALFCGCGSCDTTGRNVGASLRRHKGPISTSAYLPSEFCKPWGLSNL